MNLSTQLHSKLKPLIGRTGSDPTTVTLAGPDQITFAIDFTAVETMGCSFREVRLNVPSLANAGTELLEKWAADLCRRVTYLLENLGPVEFDSEAGQVLIRSTPPETEDRSRQFYEVILQAHNAGTFSLKRYRAERGRPGREPVEMQTTHKVLEKLLGDLVASIPRTST